MRALILILLIMVVIILVFGFWPAGDLNFNGKVTLTDLVIMKAGKLNLLQMYVADMNHDGKVDLVDFTLLKNKLLDNMER